jgi:thiol-disulfide isomerase/thioredoxin
MVTRFYTALPGTRPAAVGILLLWALATVAAGAEQRTVRVGDAEIPVQVHAAAGKRALIWLPPEEGPARRQLPTAAALAERGIEVWLPDLHGAWFLAPGAYSLAEVEPAAIAALIDAAAASGKTVYLMAGARAGQLALAGLRDWQASGTGTAGGVLLLYPKLYARTPQGGEDAEFSAVVRGVNASVFVLQPELSSGWWRINTVAEALRAGGAPVYVQKLPGVSDGFEVREETRPGELDMTARLPAIVDQALTLLEVYGPAPRTVAQPGGGTARDGAESGGELLRPVAEPFMAPPLALPDLGGNQVDLATRRGRVVLVNFWATWCPPCVEEIPSLNRLHERLAPRGFEVLAVDVGETREQVQDFLRERPVTFPVLLDTTGESFKGWKAYAFPTSLLLDRQHRVRYAVYGAFAWDSPEVVEIVSRLLDEP